MGAAPSSPSRVMSTLRPQMVDGSACNGRHQLPRPLHRDAIDGSERAVVARIVRRFGSHIPRPARPRNRRGRQAQACSATNVKQPPRMQLWSARTAEERVSHEGRITRMTSYYQYCGGKSKVSKVTSAACMSKQRELQDRGVMLGGGLPPTRHVVRNPHHNRGGSPPVRTAIWPPQRQSVDAALVPQEANDVCSVLLIMSCSHTRQEYESDGEVTSKTASQSHRPPQRGEERG